MTKERLRRRDKKIERGEETYYDGQQRVEEQCKVEFFFESHFICKLYMYI
jgi:hypothetical protein